MTLRVVTCKACGGAMDLHWNRLRCQVCGRVVYVKSPVK